MISLPGQFLLILAGALLSADPASNSSPAGDVEAGFFNGRWAFVEDSCDLPANWTLISGGIFVSEDLTGNWEWREGRLVLSLTDLAIDEETGEAGGRFQMEGPVEIVGQNAFKMTVVPAVYEMKRCPNLLSN